MLRAIKEHPIAVRLCQDIDSPALVEFAKDLLADKQPQTVGNYMSHLAAVFAVARAAWGFPLNVQAMAEARTVLKRLNSPVLKSVIDQAVSGTMATTSSAGSALTTATTTNATVSAV